MLKRNRRQPLGENIAELVLGINLNQFNISWTNMFAKPMVFNGVVFGARCHSARFELAESKSTDIVFVNLDVKVGVLRDSESTSSSKLSNKIKERKEIFASCAQCYILSFHGGESNFGLKFALPKDGAVGNANDKTGTTSDTVWILCVFFVVKACKVSVGIAVHVDVFGWVHDDAFQCSSFEVAANAFESGDMFGGWLEGVSSALVNSEGNVWARVAR